MNTKIFKLALIFILFSALCSLSYAEIPKLINYQGRLTDSQGKPLTTAKVTFRIYDADTAGNLLWEEIYNPLQMDKGIFNVLLGGKTPLNLAFEKQYYLAIQVGSDLEMYPRQRLASVSYAFTAQNLADTLPISKGGTGQVTATTALNVLLPSQSGNADNVLKTDGTNANWTTDNDGGLKFGWWSPITSRSGNQDGNKITACKDVCVTNGVVTALKILVGDSEACRMIVGIYSNNSGGGDHPDTKLASSAEIIIPAGLRRCEIVYAPLTSPLKVTAGTTYWLAVTTDVIWEVLAGGTPEITTLACSTPRTYNGQLPDSFPSPRTADYRPMISAW